MRAGVNDLLITLGNTYLQEYYTQIFHYDYGHKKKISPFITHYLVGRQGNMNRDLWVKIAELPCDRTHSQFGILAIVSALMVVVNKEIWKAFLDYCLSILK